MSWPLHINTQGATPVCSVHNALGVNPGVIAGASGRGDLTIRQLTRCPRLSARARTLLGPHALRRCSMCLGPHTHTHTLSLSLHNHHLVQSPCPKFTSRADPLALNLDHTATTIAQSLRWRACVGDGTPPAIPRGELARVHVFDDLLHPSCEAAARLARRRSGELVLW